MYIEKKMIDFSNISGIYDYLFNENILFIY